MNEWAVRNECLCENTRARTHINEEREQQQEK